MFNFYIVITTYFSSVFMVSICFFTMSYHDAVAFSESVYSDNIAVLDHTHTQACTHTRTYTHSNGHATKVETKVGFYFSDEHKHNKSISNNQQALLP